LGGGYQAGGAWYYPQASYSAVQTGLATIYADGHAKLTSDGEKFDQHALAAAHQTLQLPAIARLTNLESGRQVLVRINDRGPAAPDRLVAVTRRTAELLAFPPSGIAHVRLEILPAESHAAAEAVGGASFLRENGLERFMRDIHAARFHPLQTKRQHRFTGRMTLGLDPVTD